MESWEIQACNRGAKTMGVEFISKPLTPEMVRMVVAKPKLSSRGLAREEILGSS